MASQSSDTSEAEEGVRAAFIERYAVSFGGDLVANMKAFAPDDEVGASVASADIMRGIRESTGQAICHLMRVLGKNVATVESLKALEVMDLGRRFVHECEFLLHWRTMRQMDAEARATAEAEQKKKDKRKAKKKAKKKRDRARLLEMQALAEAAAKKDEEADSDSETDDSDSESGEEI